MLKKGTKRYSIQKLKCPRCHEGDLFVNPTFFVYKKMLEMPNKCTICGQDFVIEPGFYTAALWISYPILLIVIIPTIATGVIMKDTNFFLRTCMEVGLSAENRHFFVYARLKNRFMP